MVAFGGGGPLHACALAGMLGIPGVVVPPGPGLFSAAGLLTSPLKVALVRPVLTAASQAQAEQVAAHYASMRVEAVADLERQGAAGDSIELAHTLDLRYAGQSFELSVPAAPAEQGWLDNALQSFHRRHRDVYGYESPDHPVEIVAARLAASARPLEAPMPTRPAVLSNPPAPEPRATRPVYFEEAGGFVETPIYWRDHLAPGAALNGPAVVEQYDTTTLLHPGWQLAVDGDGNMVLTRRE
jgi:N-methylhydantoinase A